MADTVEVEYIYPPNMLDGDFDEHSGNRHVVVQLLGLSDGTGETNVKKVDLTDLKHPNGSSPARVAVEKIDYHTSGMGATLNFDRTPAKLIARIPIGDNGCVDFTNTGGKVDTGGDGGTGDILLTSVDADAGDTYDITLTLKLKDA